MNDDAHFGENRTPLMTAQTKMKLLTRDEFKQQVFKRDNGECVRCSKPAVDAHHILDRKLWVDGGYYLDNGVSVCNDCHLLCEATIISVEEIRRLAGITTKIVPPGFDLNGWYDKWGNTIINQYKLVAGPLAEDTGMLRALKTGRKIQFLMKE